VRSSARWRSIRSSHSKAKLCEALKASDYTCDVLLDETQANQLGRFLSVNGYTSGTLERSGGTITATIRVRDIGSSGLASLFTVSVSNPGTAASVGEAIAQRLNNLVRAAEQARECDDQRKKSQFREVAGPARKALAIEPNLPAARSASPTCTRPAHAADSMLAAYQRATKGDSLNATAWETSATSISRRATRSRRSTPWSTSLRVSPQHAAAARHRGAAAAAEAVCASEGAPRRGLAKNPNEQRFIESRQRICIEGELWRLHPGRFRTADQDRLQQGQGQYIPQGRARCRATGRGHPALLFFSRTAVANFSKSAAFWKALGSAYD